MAPPKIIAGPMLRRTAADSVSVWVACSENLGVTLRLYEGSGVKLSAQSGDFSTVSGGVTEVATIDDSNRNIHPRATTVKFGPRLWVCVVTAKPVVALQTNQLYSYNLQFESSDNPLLKADLRSEGFLEDKTTDKRKQLAIGYKKDILPTFVLPGATPESLCIAQASCRKAHGHGPDAMAHLDKELKDSLPGGSTTVPDLSKRPQQLFLTGDQVYADDVPAALLRNLAGVDTFGTTLDDKIQVEVDGATRDINVGPGNLPPFMRQELVTERGGLTSGSASCHVLSFGEFCGLYLHYWSLRAWSQSLIDQIAKLKDGSREKLGEVTDTLFDGATGDNGISDLIDTALGTADGRNLLLTDHIRDTFVAPSSSAADREKQEKALDDWRKGRKKKLRDELKELASFFDALPKVSRVLANVPSYMIFDDHEVTDDWYLNQRWKNEVLSKKLGRDILRNGMMAYCVFQDWGNRPDDYVAIEPAGGDEPSKHTSLIRAIADFCHETMTRPDSPSLRRSFVEPIEEKLGMGASNSDAISWHYQVGSGPATTIVLDTRTRRHYESLNSAPGLLDSAALSEQIPATNPSGASAPFLIVVSAAPAPGLASFEQLIQPAYVAVSGMGAKAGRHPGILKGMISADYEAWGFRPASLEGLLDRLSAHKKVLILSGDVHYGFSSVLDYWKGTTRAPKSRIVTFTASASKNEEYGLLHLYRSALAQKILTGIGDGLEKLGWKDRVLSVTGPVSMRNRQRLRDNPAVVPTAGWLAGSQVNRAPDFRWRMKVLQDDTVREGSLITDDIVVGNEASMDTGYDNVVLEHQKNFISGVHRRMVWPANVGILKFEGSGDTLKVIHEFLFAANRRSDKPKVGKHIKHEAVLQASGDAADRPELP